MNLFGIVIPYVNYREREEFYTIPQLCELFDMDKSSLRKKCEQYDIKPRRNEIGEYGLVKYDVRKLHNTLYYEDRMEDDPWV